VVGANEPPVALSGNVSVECAGPSGSTVTLDGSASYDPEGGALTYSWYENGSIIAGPATSATSELLFTTGMHLVTLEVVDECGQASQTDISVTIEDSNGPAVVAEFLPSVKPHEFEISCSAEDLCSEVVSSVSVILIPELTNPSVSLKNNPNYSLMIDQEKNSVNVKAPNALAFWTMILAKGGVPVNDGQVIVAKGDKNKYKFDFDKTGSLVAVAGEIITLRCTTTDGNGNTSAAEATLPAGLLKSDESMAGSFNDAEGADLYRNYPNPFTQSTTIEFVLEKPAFVNVSVLDQVGRIIEQLESKVMPEGVHKISWDASQHDPGIYFYRIEVDGNPVTGKMSYIKH
jgi:hypothetical protein